jgi:hypothetical protein
MPGFSPSRLNFPKEILFDEVSHFRKRIAIHLALSNIRSATLLQRAKLLRKIQLSLSSRPVIVKKGSNGLNFLP